MDASKLTTKSQEALAAAVRLAADRGNPDVDPAHLFSALLAQTDGATGPLLQAGGIQAARARSEGEALLSRLPSASGSTVAAPQTSRNTLQVLNAAERSAEQHND